MCTHCSSVFGNLSIQNESLKCNKVTNCIILKSHHVVYESLNIIYIKGGICMLRHDLKLLLHQPITWIFKNHVSKLLHSSYSVWLTSFLAIFSPQPLGQVTITWPHSCLMCIWNTHKKNNKVAIGTTIDTDTSLWHLHLYCELSLSTMDTELEWTYTPSPSVRPVDCLATV